MQCIIHPPACSSTAIHDRQRLCRRAASRLQVVKDQNWQCSKGKGNLHSKLQRVRDGAILHGQQWVSRLKQHACVLCVTREVFRCYPSAVGVPAAGVLGSLGPTYQQLDARSMSSTLHSSEVNLPRVWIPDPCKRGGLDGPPPGTQGGSAHAGGRGALWTVK